ncbi:zinc ABC transporter substrate-binding protein [Bacillus carboniphilus]|uniref:Zinc ABC transporter substrate-binding protein n=1 Tax=Bacillus carboniphilus TaxID=86663 RepID=A0ABY9JU51_9BACI|nr:zinc ABC transporter substrate-binding protein [Bacillus carboniphilus]WLR41195.1 zinc ABC transporter substrate-binding protein [Bacillus carboniphilus]
MKKWMLSVISLLILFIISACGTEEASNGNSEGKVKVTTTIAQIGDIVKNVGGDHVEVESLMGPGTDPHLYQASQGDIKKLNNAEVIFYNGLHLEGKMGEVLEKMSENKPTVAVADAIPEDELIQDPANPNAHDPHVWFNIELWKYAVDAVAEQLIESDKENEEDYLANADSYKKQLDTLLAESKKKVEEIPEDSRVLVTAHDAFAYFGEQFEFEVLGLQGLSTDSEYGLKDVQNLVNTLTERQIKAVFIESSINPGNLDPVVEGAKEKGHEVSIGGELFSDAMGEEGTEEGTYIGMYKHNINTIVDSLK